MDLVNINKDRKNRRKPSIDISTIVYGKVPPNAKEIEESVLGAILTHGGLITTVIDILKPECFYVDAHQRIYKNMIGLFIKNEPIDILLILESLKANDELDIIGGPYALTLISGKATGNVEQHSRIIFQKFVQREMIRIAGEIISEGYEDSTDVFDLLDIAQNKFYQLSVGTFKKDFIDLETSSVNTMNEIDKKMNKKPGELTGVYSGFNDIDNCTGGWQATDLIIVAARPSVGKTCWSLNVAVNAASKGIGVGFFSLEMSASQLNQRIFSSESGIDLKLIRDGELDLEQHGRLVNEIAPSLGKMPIYIDDTANLNILEFKAKARRLMEKHKIGLFIIDYLQLMSGLKGSDKKTRNDELGEVSRGLKIFAKEMGVPVIALSQLSREVEKRTNPIPNLGDLRDCGAIEQDADLVLFLYTQDEIPKIKIGKHRNGSLKIIKLKSNLNIQKFYDFDGEKSSPFKINSKEDFDEGFEDPEKDNFNFK